MEADKVLFYTVALDDNDDARDQGGLRDHLSQLARELDAHASRIQTTEDKLLKTQLQAVDLEAQRSKQLVAWRKLQNEYTRVAAQVSLDKNNDNNAPAAGIGGKPTRRAGQGRKRTPQGPAHNWVRGPRY